MREKKNLRKKKIIGASEFCPSKFSLARNAYKQVNTNVKKNEITSSAHGSSIGLLIEASEDYSF